MILRSGGGLVSQREDTGRRIPAAQRAEADVGKVRNDQIRFNRGGVDLIRRSGNDKVRAFEHPPRQQSSPHVAVDNENGRRPWRWAGLIGGLVEQRCLGSEVSTIGPYAAAALCAVHISPAKGVAIKPFV
jgi:hypothetical protein